MKRMTFSSAMVSAIERDGGGDEAGGAERLAARLVGGDAEHAGDQERDEQRGHDRQPELHIRDVAGEGADRRVRGEREIGKAQHRVDRGQPDGRHRQDGAGHDAVEDELQDFGQHPVRTVGRARVPALETPWPWPVRAGTRCPPYGFLVSRHGPSNLHLPLLL